jgi:hypothetical protein
MTASLVAAAIVFVPLPAWAQAPPADIPACAGPAVELWPSSTQMYTGELPAFRLTIRNTSRDPVRVVNVAGGRRADLQVAYLELVVTDLDDREVPLPRAIADPGPIGADDIIALRPGTEMSVSPVLAARDLRRLRPGVYRAVTRVQRDPLEPSTRCESTLSSLRVEAHPRVELERRLRAMANAELVDCGRIQTDWKRPQPVPGAKLEASLTCASTATAGGRAFTVIIDGFGIDSWLAQGLFGAPDAVAQAFSYDSLGSVLRMTPCAKPQVERDPSKRRPFHCGS